MLKFSNKSHDQLQQQESVVQGSSTQGNFALGRSAHGNFTRGTPIQGNPTQVRFEQVNLEGKAAHVAHTYNKIHAVSQASSASKTGCSSTASKVCVAGKTWVDSQTNGDNAESGVNSSSIADDMLFTMAQDLGIQRFVGESDLSFLQRVLYSGLGCWLKTLALNSSVNELVPEHKLKSLITWNLTQLLKEFLWRYPEAQPYFIPGSTLTQATSQQDGTKCVSPQPVRHDAATEATSLESKAFEATTTESTVHKASTSETATSDVHDADEQNTDEQRAEDELASQISLDLKDEIKTIPEFELENHSIQNQTTLDSLVVHTTAWLLRSRLLRLKDIISIDSLSLTMAESGTEKLNSRLTLLRGCLLEKGAFYSGVACLTRASKASDLISGSESGSASVPGALDETHQANWNFLSARTGSWEQLFLAVKGGIFKQPEDWLESYLAHALWIDVDKEHDKYPYVAAYAVYVQRLKPHFNPSYLSAPDIPEWMKRVEDEGLQIKFFNTTLADKVRLERLWDSRYPRFEHGELPVVLCKTCETLRENERYFLWHQPTGRFHELAMAACQAQEYYRFMFALICKAQHHIWADVQAYQDHVQVHLPSRLPELESRLLETLAWPVRSVRDMYCWQMSLEVWDFIRSYLQALGLQWRMH